MRAHLLVVAPLGLLSKPALHAHLVLGEPPPHPNDAPDEGKDDDGAHGDAHAVRGDVVSAPDVLVVEEAVHVEPLRGVGDVREAQVSAEQDQQPHDVNPKHGRRPGDQHLEERKGRVGRVLADVFPSFDAVGEPGAGEQDGPVHDRYHKREYNGGGIVRRVQGLERARKAIEERPTPEGIGCSVYSGEKEVKGQAPVGKDGEVAEAASCVTAPVLGRRAGYGHRDEAGREAIGTLRTPYVNKFRTNSTHTGMMVVIFGQLYDECTDCKEDPRVEQP